MATLKTPLYDLSCFPDVYDPSQDTFLFLDALEAEITFLQKLRPVLCAEIGSGSGVAIAALAAILGHTESAYFATDINAEATAATVNTSMLNGVYIESTTMDLLENFRLNSFDVVLFNPPYVVTDFSEIVNGKGLNRAYAGGQNGREIINQVLAKLNCYLSDRGVCYMVLLKENGPHEIMGDMAEQGFDCRVIKERKIPGEHLYVVKFAKKVN